MALFSLPLWISDYGALLPIHYEVILPFCWCYQLCSKIIYNAFDLFDLCSVFRPTLIRPPRDIPFTRKVSILVAFLKVFSLLSPNLAKKNFKNYFLWASCQVKGHIRSNFQNENFAILMADSESLQKTVF